MNRLNSMYLLVVLLIPSAVLSAQSPARTTATQRLSVNTVESRVNWIGKKVGGEHNGYVKLSEGEIHVRNNEVAGGSFTINLNAITVLDVKDEGMNARLVGHLKSADFFDVEKYPTATFIISKVTRLPGSSAGSAGATHRIEGNLTMKDITRKISFDASINMLNGKLTASTPPFTINRTHWGVNYQSKSIFAELKDQFIYDDMTLSVELVSK